ncbi:MAG: sigma 54-interacting transcriptional regulator [Deltaproteobacteria bacterium]|nr:sigma 54-interacting transcriptional regulator [Deltaproteobacteria bacterium]
MPIQYEPKDHIQHLTLAPRSENILDQREITIQSYQTTIPFDYDALNSRFDAAWITPQVRFGVFARTSLNESGALNVILGLQDDLSVRAYDYDQRRSLWYTWKNVIVDTVSIRYFRDEDGLLRFKTTGGGRRITDELLYDFNSSFLKIPKEAVQKRHFDLDKLRDLCFKRFSDRLYMFRFSDPSGEEYRSIDHALFQSRRYINPQAKRFQEIRNDAKVTIESFDSDIEMRAEELAAPIQVRFFIRGLSGSLGLRFPKIIYKNEMKTVEEQAYVFYRLVDVTENSILDADYYTNLPRTLDELDVELGLFPDTVDLAPFREIFTNMSARVEFFENLDLGAPWQKWKPQLQAIDELLASKLFASHVSELMTTMAKTDAQHAMRVLATCHRDPKMRRLGSITAQAVANELQSIQSEVRSQVEELLLSWAVDYEEDSWNLDPKTGEIGVLNLRWRVEDLSFDILPSILWKIVGLLHARLTASTDGVEPLLEQFSWCMTVAKALPSNHSKNLAALRLVAAGRVPLSVHDGANVLKKPVTDLRALDEGVLNQYGLPLWPYLTACRNNGKIIISNSGIGTAIGTVAYPSGFLFGEDDQPAATDISPNKSASFPMASNVTTVAVEFEKFGRRYHMTLKVTGEMPSSPITNNIRVLSDTIYRKRRVSQHKYREEIDPQGIVIGSSSAILEVFENIKYANAMDDCSSVLLLGEPGVGKTHIAQLLHDSSSRAAKKFKAVNAGGGGGDLNIQRGEWIGYGKGHGIQGVDPKGRPGHLMNVDGGTLFVDEFATLSQDLQVIFLSVLEGRPIQKIGGEEVTPDVRCIFATNADIEKAIASGTLRQDLVDRIGITFTIPPLRERRGDVLILAKHFAADHNITDRCLAALIHYNWPGNVRELQKLIERASARKQTENASAIDLIHLDLAHDIIAPVKALGDDTCRRELWHLADEIARNEGFEPGAGLQHRAGEIMGVSDGQASKMYQAYGLAIAATA